MVLADRPVSTQVLGEAPVTDEQTVVHGPVELAPRANVVVLLPLASPLKGAETVTSEQEVALAVGVPGVTRQSRVVKGPITWGFVP